MIWLPTPGARDTGTHIIFHRGNIPSRRDTASPAKTTLILQGKETWPLGSEGALAYEFIAWTHADRIEVINGANT
jgi:hypothetical protein